jgi:hypothetical protein
VRILAAFLIGVAITLLAVLFRPNVFQCKELGSKRELSILEEAAGSFATLPSSPFVLRNFHDTGYNLIGIVVSPSDSIAWVMANPECRPLVKVLITEPGGYNVTGHPLYLTSRVFRAISDVGLLN